MLGQCVLLRCLTRMTWMFLVYVDLAEMETLFGRRGLWSTRWPALARFRRADYLGDATRPLAECVREMVEQQTGRRPDDPPTRRSDGPTVRSGC